LLVERVEFIVQGSRFRAQGLGFKVQSIVVTLNGWHAIIVAIKLFTPNIKLLALKSEP